METFGKYELLKRIGAGGMGEVFLARVAGTAEPVVLKRILPHLTANSRFLRLFLDECRIAARLRHPNIATIHELGEVSGTWFVAMEHVPGKDLRELLKRSWELEIPTQLEVALKIGLEISKALEFAHHARAADGSPLEIVHRDVSPHNVLVSRFGDVKLIDFGVARAANKALHTRTGILKGKFPYMAPEQATAKQVDGRTDVFALGIVLWEMLCRRFLFRGKSDASTLKLVRACEVPAPSLFNEGLPKRVDKVLLKALEKEPRNRWQSAKAFGEALEEILVGLPAANLQRFFDDLDDGDEDELPAAQDPSELQTEEEAGTVETVHVRVNPRGQATPQHSEPEDATRSERSQANAKLLETAQLLSAISGRPTNLAPQPTSFVGRVAELADLHQLFQDEKRLITLLGPGGTGKTRLSIQFAGQLVSHFQGGKSQGKGGVWFCDLTEAQTLDGVADSVAKALDLRLTVGDPVAQVGHAIAGRGETLLVLDNFEQVVAHASATVEKWMQQAPKARFVVSSRELLKIPHEAVFEVPPLRVPQKDQEARASEAVELFIERARSVRPNWEPSKAEELAVAEIVRQLDGMPLAIELAAARMGVLSPMQLVQRLPRRFEMLASRDPNASERQGTLRGAIDWSWRMLSPEEQTALAQLSLFRGGFSIEAAEAVVSLGDSATEVLSMVLTLRSKSLVRGYYTDSGGGEMRYGLFETIREYGLEKLRGAPGEAEAIERHAKFFLALGGRLATGAEGNAALLDALDLERENINAVYQRALETRKGARALQAMLCLDPLLALRGPFALHLMLLDSALAAATDADPLRRALGFEARVRARLARGKPNEAFEDVMQMLALAQESGAVEVEGRAFSHRGNIEALRGNAREARQNFDEALARHRKVGDRRMEGRTLANLALLLDEMGREDEALATYQEALEIHRAVGDRRYEGITLSNLGVQQQNQGLFGQAKLNYQAALTIHRELGNRSSEGIAHINLGDLDRDLEQGPQAMLHYQNALEILQKTGSRRLEGLTLLSIAQLYQEQGRLEDAIARFQQAVDVLIEVVDRRSEGLARAGLAAAQGTLGAFQRAEEQLAEATRLLNEANDAGLLDALDIYRAHFELAQSLKEKDDTTASGLERTVEARVQRAEQPMKATAQHPAGMPSPAERSEYVRVALRSLRAAMRRAGKGR